MPTVRDPSNYTYFKEETGKVMAGFFEPRGKVWSLEGIPRDLQFKTLPEDWDHVGPIFERAIHRMPVLGEAGLQLFFNGPEAFTPDGVYYLGESPEVDRCFVAAGFNSVGIQSAGGVGWVLADWIADDHPPMDLSVVDIRRSFGFQCEPAYLDARIPESLGLLYAMHWPFRQYETARNIRRSPLHERIDAAGAVFGEVGGWERPNWYAAPGQEREYRYSWGPQNWFEASEAECDAVRNAVGLFDQTSFAKFTVEGPDAMALLNWVCANEVDVPVGAGGVHPVAQRLRRHRGRPHRDPVGGRTPIGWSPRQAPPPATGLGLRRAARGRDVAIEEVTDSYAVLGIMGPNSRAVLNQLCEADLGNDGFPFGTAQDLSIAGVEALALRMTYVGELGWELYVPNEHAVALHDAVVDAGSPFGLRHAGYHAMNTLRMEAAYCHWGHDITDEDTPLEAGLGFAVAWDKVGGFRGQEALAAQREAPRTKRLVKFRLEDSEWLLYHDEPIYRDGEMVGRTSSGMWSYTEGRALAMGYVNCPDGVSKAWLEAGRFEIEVAGRRIAATPSLRSFYDPRKERVRL